MKDNRFIELLNLYIDRQITVAETAELEAEIQQNPSRQAVYRQYCQIHAASKLVYDSFRAEATEQPALRPDRAGVVELFETKQRRKHILFYAAGGLAAACLALVFVRYNAAPAAVAPLASVQATVRPAVVPPAATAVAAAPTSVKTGEPAVGLVSLRNSVTSSPDYSAMLAALREQDEERAIAATGHFPNRVQSLFDDGLFNANRVVPVQDPRLFRIQQTQAQQAETTIFQFQR
jgi:hypothetical protein